jgi:membrane protease YdiL (CAAX protease family)
MSHIFFDQTDRLRSGWRAAAFLGAYVPTAAIMGIMAHVVLQAAGVDIVPGTMGFMLLNGVLSLIPAIVFGWLCAKFFEKLPFRALGVSFSYKALRHFGGGSLLGAASIAFAVLTAWLFGGERFELNAEAGVAGVAASLIASFFVFAAAAAFEETVFRGYILQTFERSGLAWLAVALTSVFFGLVHLGNPNATLISTANTIIAGIWFSLAYLKTRDLWFVWGMHLMWNWMQGSIFGIEVSGVTSLAAAPLLREIDNGPTWLTGTTYGIEGGIACTIALVISLGLVYFLPLSESPA